MQMHLVHPETKSPIACLFDSVFLFFLILIFLKLIHVRHGEPVSVSMSVDCVKMGLNEVFSAFAATFVFCNV